MKLYFESVQSFKANTVRYPLYCGGQIFRNCTYSEFCQNFLTESNLGICISPKIYFVLILFDPVPLLDTLCRYNVGNLARLVYDLLAEYLIKNKGYDRTIKNRQFDDDLHMMAKGSGS